MIHIRIDNDVNSKQKMACGIGPELPEGDTYFFDSEGAAYRHADCPGCNPGGPAKGTPISELSGRPGHDGFDKFKADTFFGPDELTAAVTKFRSTALAQTTTEGKCQEVRIHSIASIAAITLKV